jgi:hypothetical protein
MSARLDLLSGSLVWHTYANAPISCLMTNGLAMENQFTAIYLGSLNAYVCILVINVPCLKNWVSTNRFFIKWSISKILILLIVTVEIFWCIRISSRQFFIQFMIDYNISYIGPNGRSAFLFTLCIKRNFECDLEWYCNTVSFSYCYRPNPADALNSNERAVLAVEFDETYSHM